eukprot:COSAG01_NODE_712_length_14100_cov_12.382758_1_plen_318_part_00
MRHPPVRDPSTSRRCAGPATSTPNPHTLPEDTGPDLVSTSADGRILTWPHGRRLLPPPARHCVRSPAPRNAVQRRPVGRAQTRSFERARVRSKMAPPLHTCGKMLPLACLAAVLARACAQPSHTDPCAPTVLASVSRCALGIYSRLKHARPLLTPLAGAGMRGVAHAAHVRPVFGVRQRLRSGRHSMRTCVYMLLRIGCIHFASGSNNAPIAATRAESSGPHENKQHFVDLEHRCAGVSGIDPAPGPSPVPSGGGLQHARFQRQRRGIQHLRVYFPRLNGLGRRFPRGPCGTHLLTPPKHVVVRCSRPDVFVPGMRL